MRTSRLSFGVLAVVALLVSSIAPAGSQPATPTAGDLVVLGPDELYAGATRGEWDARWWQYTLSFPLDEGPAFDVWGEQCGLGQNGPVFFLPARLTQRPVTYTCAIPAGMAIYVPLATAECSTVEPPPYFGRNEEELRACAVEAMEQLVDVKAYVDRQPIPDIASYATTSPLFTLHLPENNFLSAPTGVAKAVSSTYGFLIAPPPPGEYRVAMSVKFPQGPTTFFVDFWEIRFVVEAPQVVEPGATPGATPMV